MLRSPDAQAQASEGPKESVVGAQEMSPADVGADVDLEVLEEIDEFSRNAVRRRLLQCSRSTDEVHGGNKLTKVKTPVAAGVREVPDLHERLLLQTRPVEEVPGFMRLDESILVRVRPEEEAGILSCVPIIWMGSVLPSCW